MAVSNSQDVQSAAEVLASVDGFTVSCLPVKVAGASAGWCRAAAIVE